MKKIWIVALAVILVIFLMAVLHYFIFIHNNRFYMDPTDFQLVTQTTPEQAKRIEALLEENNIVWKEIRWSKTNYVLEDEGIFEYYDILADDGKEYLLTLAIHNDQVYKQVYSIVNQTDKTIEYRNEDLWPKQPSWSIDQ